MKWIHVLLTLFLFCCSGLGQKQTTSTGVPVESFSVTASEKLAGDLPAVIALPVQCGQDGTAYARFADYSNALDIYGIRVDGRTVRFDLSKINDVQHPMSGAFTISSDALYILVNGLENVEFKSAKVVAPDKTIKDAGMQMKGTPHSYIVRFELDGTYKGATKLSLPFAPYTLGVFSQGQFLIAGADDEGNPKLAVTSESGEFNRYVTLEGDISENSEQLRDAAKRSGRSLSAELREVSLNSDIVSDTDGTLLLIRREQNEAPIFKVSSDGRAKSIRVQSSGMDLFSVRPSASGLIAQFTKQLANGQTSAVETYLIDPASGALLRRYVFDEPLGFGLGCMQSGTLTAFKRDEAQNATLLLKTSAVH